MSQTCPCGAETGGTSLCQHCARTLAYSIANIAAYYDDLDLLAARQARYGSGATTRTVGTEQPLPIDGRFAGGDEDGSRLRDDGRNTISTWCRVIEDDMPPADGPVCQTCLHQSCAEYKRRRPPKLDTTDQGRPTATVRSMCLYLDRMHRWIEAAPYGPAMLDELGYLERQLRRMVDRPADRWYAGKCDCGEDMYAIETNAEVSCRHCDATYDVASRREFLLKQAQDYHVTATEAATALLSWTDYDGTITKLVDRIRKWRDRDQLEVADVTSLSGRDRHLYRLGDVQALLVSNAQTQRLRVVEANG